MRSIAYNRSSFGRVIGIREALLEKAAVEKYEVDGKPGVWRRVGNANVFFPDDGSPAIGMPTFANGDPDVEDPKVKKKSKGGSSKYALRGTQLPNDVQKRLKQLKVRNIPNAEIPVGDIKYDLSPKGIHERAVISWRENGVLKHGYTPQFHEKNARKKWDRVRRFEGRVPKIISKLSSEIGKKHGTTKHQGAMIAMIIAKTGLRPGSEKSVDERGRYGVSTLRKEHVSIDGDKVSIDFIGKAGEQNRAEIKDPAIAKSLSQYIGESRDGSIFPDGDRAARAAHKLLPSGMKLKDLRTIMGTKIARDALKEVSIPKPTGNEKKDKRELLRALNDASDIVAGKLNNTKAVAKGHYIHPEVFEAWIDENGYSYLSQ